MLNWVDVKDKIKPPTNRPLICWCKDWSLEEYQIAVWDGRKFTFDAEPNDMFNSLVKKWAIFNEVE